jgi:hypothetical protein
LTAFAARAGGGGVTPRLFLRLDERLEILDRRLSEQEALLARFRESLGMPQQRAVPTRSPEPGSTSWRTTALAGGYVLGVFAKLIIAGTMTVLALAVVAGALRLISR